MTHRHTAAIATTQLPPTAERFTLRERPVSGTLWHPAGHSPRGVLLVHPATAVPERLYRRFAAHAAERGLAVVTYDWSGTGQSGEPRAHRHVRVRDWLDVDAPAVTAWARDRHPGLPMVAVGHSVGGHALILGAGRGDLAACATIACHAGVTAAIPDRRERLRVGAVLSVLGPGLGRLLGRVPGSALGLGEDMPTDAMVEWGRWTRLPGYFYDDPTMHAEHRAAQVTGPVHAMGFTDDLWATRQQIEAVHGGLTHADLALEMVDPSELGVSRIGHMGFFRVDPSRPQVHTEGLWPRVLDPLLRHAGLG